MFVIFNFRCGIHSPVNISFVMQAKKTNKHKYMFKNVKFACWIIAVWRVLTDVK